MADDFKIELTGNPFVDHGLAVIAHLADLDEIADLHYRHLVHVHGDGSRLARRNALTKAFSMIFTANSLLIHPSTKRSERQQERYRQNYLAILKALLDAIPASKGGVHLCEACGRFEAVSFPKLTLEALKGVDDDIEAKEIGRDWFPLVGSISEVQALPGGGRSYRFCPLCLFAVHYLSLSMQLMDGKLVCLQSNHSEFWYQLIRNSTSEMTNRLDAGLPDIPGGGQGSLYFLVTLINLFEKLQGEKLHTELPYDVSLILWLWSNSGQGPSCDWIRVPHISLRFLWQVVGEGFKPALTDLLMGTGDRGTRSFFHCLSSGGDYHGFYPKKKWPGADSELFTMYQQEVCQYSAEQLAAAQAIARQMLNAAPAKERVRLLRSEIFQESEGRRLLRQSVTGLVEQGKITYFTYASLFSGRNHGEPAGYKFVRYFLHHSEAVWKSRNNNTQTRKEDMFFLAVAQGIKKAWHNTMGRGKKDLLSMLDSIKPDWRWLRRRYLGWAMLDERVDLDIWRWLTTVYLARPNIYELFFRLRLAWLEPEGQTMEQLWEPPASLLNHDALPVETAIKIREALNSLVCHYLGQRGLARFKKEVLGSLISGDLGLQYLRRVLTTPWFGREEAFIDDNIMEDYMRNEEGWQQDEERLFEMKMMIVEIIRKKEGDEQWVKH